MTGARMTRRSSPCVTCGSPGPLMRFGSPYYHGLSHQYQFNTQHEQQMGLGLGYDF